MTAPTFGIVVPCYNAAPWIAQCLGSLLVQDHADFRCVVVDDASTDGTAEAVAALALDARFELIRNRCNAGPLANICRGFARLGAASRPDDVLFNLDGDDWLARTDALSLIAEAYAAEPAPLMTYGNLARSTAPADGIGAPPPTDVLRDGAFRAEPFPLIAPRTFRARLWSALREVDLRDPETGEHWRTAGDIAFIAPLVELAGERVGFIPEVLYVYNPLSDFRLRSDAQARAATRILAMPPYARLAG